MTGSSEAPKPTDTRDLSPRWVALPRFIRTLVPGVGLLIAYLLLTLANSPSGTLGPDTGGKVATLKMMAANHTLSNVNVGYWAAAWDPQGTLHPLFRTVQVGPHWVQVTTLPMLLIGEPLWRLGGYRLALVLPMLGAVACAYAARSLAAQFGADRTRQWWAYWIVGAASPVTIYALDFWEHTIGLAFMAWGLVALVKLLSAGTPCRRFVLAGCGGLAFGAAATMRTEALVYLAIAAVVVGVVILKRDRRIAPWFVSGAALAVGTLIPLLMNVLLSRWILGGDVRTGRAAGAADGIGSELGLRVREGLVITFGQLGTTSAEKIVTGGLVALLIGFSVVKGRKRRSIPRRQLLTIVGAVGLLYLFTFLNGFDWVNGIVATAPLAAAGATVAWMLPRRRHLPSAVAASVALFALPAVWAVRWTGGQELQWSGRYILCTMLILVVIGVVELPNLRKPVPQVLVGLSVAVTVFGLAFFSIHTHNVDRLFTRLDARAEPVLVADGLLADLPREGGAFYGDHRWLVTHAPASRRTAATVVREAGFTSFGMVHLSDVRVPSHIGRFGATHSAKTGSYQGIPLTLTTYRLEHASSD